MTKSLRSALALVAVVVVAACTDTPMGAPAAEAVRTKGAIAHAIPGECSTLDEMARLAGILYDHETTSPDVNTIKGRLAQLDHAVSRGRLTEAEGHATWVVQTTLRSSHAGTLHGTPDDVRTFVNTVLCFAGIDIVVDAPDDSHLVLPTDGDQTLKNDVGTAGVVVPPGAVTEPTLIAIQLAPQGGDGPLDTKLDQYPGFIHIVKLSENDSPLTQPVIVGVCADGVIPQEVRDRLRLGHGASTGFEITPPASADFLVCPNEVAEAKPGSVLERVANLILPRRLQAATASYSGGGVGGTVTEFSPLAPVDPLLEFGGGVGGTVTEFIRVNPFAELRSDAPNATKLTGPCASPIEGAMGSPLRDECRPSVTIHTRLGTPFTGVPVSWEVTQGGGAVGANTGTCGPLAATAATLTGPHGGAGVCWTLGSVGANRVVARPSLGGDAVAGVTFSQAEVVFNAIANPPAGLAFTVPPSPVVPAYPGFPLQVTIVDRNGERVWASTDRVFLRLNQNTFASNATEMNLKAVQGIVNFSVGVPTPATGYRITASASVSSWAIANSTTDPFTVVPGAPFKITVLAGDLVTAPPGTVVNARVRVYDRVGNAVPGAGLTWAVTAGAGSVTPPGSVTDASGEAAAAWTIGAGANKLRVTLLSGTQLSLSLNATGAAP